MFDRDLVASGFDTETIVSEQYLTYILLAQIEAGLLSLDISDNGKTYRLRPPSDYEREYEPEPSAELPTSENRSFKIELLPGNSSPFNIVTFNLSGDRLISQSLDEMVRFWDVEDESEITTASFKIDPALGVAFNAEGDRVATTSFDHKVRLWDAQTGTLMTTFTGHTVAVECVTFSSDSLHLISGSFDKTIRLWDIQSGEEINIFTGHTSRILSVAFSPDGLRIASGSINGNIRLWDVQTGAEIFALSGHEGPVRSVAFNHDGTKLVSGSDDQIVRLWDVQEGAEVFVFDGHAGAVMSVDFNDDGTRIASGSADNTIRLWNVESETTLTVLMGHRAPVLSVAFNNDGTQLASASEDGNIRTWNGLNGQERSVLSLDFMKLTIFLNIVDEETGDIQGPFPAVLIFKVELEATKTDDGLERNHNLRLKFARFDDGTRTDLEAIGENPRELEESLRGDLDRVVSLGVAQGQQVQQIRMHKFIGAEKRSLGFYVNLAIHDGPEADAFVESRGKLFLAQDFRPSASPIAFATSPDLFALLGPDAKFRQATESEPGSGEFSYPLREDLLDATSEEIGHIKSFKVGPELVEVTTQPNSPNLPKKATGRLEVKLLAEYDFELLGIDIDPDFTVRLFFDPKRDASGIVEWDIDVRFSAGLFATLVLVAGGILLTLLFAPGLGWGSTLFVGTLMGAAVFKGFIADSLAAKLIEDRLDEENQASVLDVLPFRVPAARRRWDPFYLTEHQIVAKLDEDVVIDELGIAFVAASLSLDKQPVPETHVVIRDEERTGLDVSALRYRVRDYVDNIPNFEANAPGVDRMAFTRSDPDTEPTLVTLSRAQITERIAAKRLRAPITYTAERIHLVDNQIDHILCLSRIEPGEEKTRLINELRNEIRAIIISIVGDEVREDMITALEQELGRSPTSAEVNRRFNDEIDKLFEQIIDPVQADFEENILPERLKEAIANILRFDLAPEEFAELQQAGVLIIDGKEIIVRHNANGTVTTYYRDHPDGNPNDNLLALPHYTPPYVPD